MNKLLMIGPPSFSAFLAVVVLACVAVSPLIAAPTVVINVTPRGAERGKPVEIVVAGANLTPQTRLLLPFKATQTHLADAKPNPAQVRLQLTIDPSVPLGVYPVHLVSEDGISPLFLFSVDAFPNVNEVEDNSTFDKAQKVAVPVIITGQCAGGDVDYFRFAARKGQHLVIETESARLGSGILPQLRVTDAQKRFIAADDTQALRGDCRVSFVVPADGDYVVEISDSRYRGAAPPHYRLKIAEYDVIEDVFPLGGRRGETVAFTLRGGTLAGAVHLQRPLVDEARMQGSMMLNLEGAVRPGMLSPRVAVGNLPERLWVKTLTQDPRAFDVVPPLTINSRLEHKGDTDRFQFPVQPGQRFRISVQAETLGSYLDGVLRLTDGAGKQLLLVDDVDLPPAGPGLAPMKAADPSMDVTVPAGTTLLGVELRDQRYRGGVNFGYRLTIEPARADFLVQQPVSELNVPRGSSAALTIPLTRRGYAGPVQLTVPNLPPGLSVQGGHVPAGGTAGVLTISAAQTVAPAGPVFLQVEAKATVEGQEMRRLGEMHMVLSREANMAAAALTLSQFALAMTGPEPFTVQGPPAIEVVKGYPATVPVTLTRAANQTMLAIEVSGTAAAQTPAPGQPAPPGLLTSVPGTAAAGAASASFTVTAAANAPEEQPFELVLQGKAKVNNVDKIVSGAAATVTVHKPFAVTLPSPSLTLLPGQAVTIKGRLKRQAVFKEAVQLKLDGLPKGVTLATPLQPVAGDKSEFLIELKADAKAAAVMTNLTLTCSTTIAGLAYSHPSLMVPFQVQAGK